MGNQVPEEHRKALELSGSRAFCMVEVAGVELLAFELFCVKCCSLQINAKKTGIFCVISCPISIYAIPL